MSAQTISFTSVFAKYIFYSEALSQYHTLDKADQKIIAPYISHLKENWQEELKAVKAKLSERSSAQPLEQMKQSY